MCIFAGSKKIYFSLKKVTTVMKYLDNLVGQKWDIRLYNDQFSSPYTNSIKIMSTRNQDPNIEQMGISSNLFLRSHLTALTIKNFSYESSTRH
jgi:hypothetical protein